MAIFGLVVKKSDKITKFTKTMNNKLNDNSIIANPFRGFIKRMDYGDNDLLVILLDLVWFNPVYIAVLLTTSILFVNGFRFHWAILLSIPLWFGAFLFTTMFAKLSVRHTIKKTGYTGSIKSISDTDLIKRLANWEEGK